MRAFHDSADETAARLDACSALKIAYVMSRFPKLTETFVLYEILELEKLGVDVEVFPLLKERPSFTHSEVQKLMSRVHDHPFLSPRVLVANLHFFLRRPMRYLKVWFEALRGTWGSTNFFFGALAIFPKSVRFADEMQRCGVQHIHAHFANHPSVAAFIIHRLTGIPFSFTAHGSDLHVERRMLDKKVEAAAFVVTVSRYNKGLIVRECGEVFRDKVQVIYCGVDPEVFVGAERRAEGKPFRILCVARFEEVKGHRYLLEACRLLRDRGVEFLCHLVGEGPLQQRVAKQIAAAGLDGRVSLRGAMPRHEVSRMMAQSDVVALASTPTRNGKREGIPVVLIEAMASGLPVVASAISGIPELVEAGRTGILVTPRDVRGLADALQLLARDRKLGSRLGAAGREKVLREFNLRANAATLLGLFHRTAHRPEKGLPGQGVVKPGAHGEGARVGTTDAV